MARPLSKTDAAADATRLIVLGAASVPYRLRRSTRRSIGLQIDRAGLAVAAPQRAPLGDIEEVIRRHADWVLKKLDEWRQRPPPPAPPLIADGSRIAYLGGELELCVRVGRGRPQWSEPGGATVDVSPVRLQVNCRDDRPETVAAALRSALCERARPLFAERLAHYCALIGVPPPPLALSSARTRWGSCSARGIRLNWRLLQMPPALIDYVIAHEAAHLVEMNHGDRFWSIVASVYPDWRSARARLRENAARCLP